jgi:ABC-type lipoprotein release transport system permease subunit
MGKPAKRKSELNKRKYKITNWSEYNKSLVNRGDMISAPFLGVGITKN